MRRGYLKLTRRLGSKDKTASLLLPVGQIVVLERKPEEDFTLILWNDLQIKVREPYATIERMIQNACGIAEG